MMNLRINGLKIKMILYKIAIIMPFMMAAPLHAESLHLTIENVQPDNQPIIIYICAESEFLQSSCRYNFIKTAKHDSIEILWKDAPQGRWAVTMYHDEDNNGKMKRRFFVPQEGYGFSNITGPLLSKPKFKKAAFDIAPDIVTQITATMRY